MIRAVEIVAMFFPGALLFALAAVFHALGIEFLAVVFVYLSGIFMGVAFAELILEAWRALR